MRALFAAFLSAVLILSPGLAAASCGAADCPMDHGSAESLQGRSLRLGYEFEYIPQNKPRSYDHGAAVGQIPGDHDEKYTFTRTHRLRAAWDASDRWGVELSLPYVSRSHGHLHHDPAGDEDESWDLHGVGDLLLTGRVAVLKPEDKAAPTVSVLVGVEFPTGATERTNDAGEAAETPIQPGSGSYDFLAGLSTLQRIMVPRPMGDDAEMPAFVSGTYRWNGRSKDDYRLGSVAQFNIGVVYPLTDRLGFSGQVNLRVNRRDERGDTDQEVQKTGGTYVFLSPGIEAKLADGLTATAMVQVPVYQWVRQIQLTSPWNLMTGVSYRFRL